MIYYHKKVLVRKMVNIAHLFKLLHVILLPLIFDFLIFEFRLISRFCYVSCCGVSCGACLLLILGKIIHSARLFIPNADEIACV
jgi:hypothetical protein